MQSPTPLNPAARDVDEADGTVVFALSESEIQRFFPSLQTDRMRWINPVSCGHDEWYAFLGKHRPRIVIAGWSTPAIPQDLSIGFGGPIEYVCQVTGSVRHVVDRETLAGGLLVSNWGALVAPLVAEHALLLLLAALRNVGRWQEFMCQPVAQQRKVSLQTRSLRGKRIALHGFGAIARSLTTLLQPFQVKISGYSEGVLPALFTKHGITPASSLRACCQDADALVCCEAQTPSTHSRINAAVLSALSPNAVFVNIGRGEIAEETALIHAARTRGLRIASDVFATESLPPESPYFDLPGAILSPQIGGPTHDYFEACGRYALDNITRFHAGTLPESLVTLDIYDRST